MKRKKQTCREKSLRRRDGMLPVGEAEKINRIKISGGKSYAYVGGGK